jgi:hypothetical protein
MGMAFFFSRIGHGLGLDLENQAFCLKKPDKPALN